MSFSPRQLALVDAPPEDEFDNLTRLAARLLRAPVSMVSIVDFENDRQFFKSQTGLQEPWASQCQTPLSHSFCQHVVKQNANLIVCDAANHPLVRDNLAIRDLGVRAYLGVPIQNGAREPVGALCVISGAPREWSADDIETLTQVGQCVSRLIALKETSLSDERLRQEQRDFIYAISHDLMAPANTVKMLMTEIAIEEGWRSSDTNPLIAQVFTTLQEMTDRIQHVVLYARTLEKTVHMAPVDLNGLIAQVLADQNARIAEKNVLIECGPLPVVKGDYKQLLSLFHNLIGNALKFTAPGRRPRVRIWAEANETRHMQRIYLEDNGIGIPKSNQAQVFDLFSRLNLRDDYPGNGIGLTLCRRIAENHQGQIDLHSDGENGTTFIVQLLDEPFRRRRP